MYPLIHIMAFIQTHASLIQPMFQTTALLLGLTMLTVSILSFHDPEAFAKNMGLAFASHTASCTAPSSSSECQSPPPRATDPRAYLLLFSARELGLAVCVLVLSGLREDRALSVLLMVLGTVVAGGDTLAAGWYGRDAGMAQHAVPGVVVFGVGVMGWVSFR